MTHQPGPPLPPPIPPAPIYFPPPAYYPPAPRGGFARAVFTTLAVSVLGFSLTLNVYLLLASGLLGGGGHGVHKTTIHDGDKDHTVAVLPINGAINGNTVNDFNAVLDEIEKDAGVKALVLEINTPGGEVTASDQIYDRIQRLKKDRGLPVVVSMGALATSGGYYIACAADAVVAQRTTWTGNIGVLLPRYNFAKLAEKYGIEDATIKSTGADFKDAGSPFKPDTPEATAYFQKLADDAFVTFKDVVVKGRGLDRATVDRIANGKVYSGPDALNLKLVDVVGYLDDAVAIAVSKAGIGGGNPTSVRYEKSRGLLDAFGGGSSKLGGVDFKGGTPGVSIDRSALTDLLTPRPMYLWQGQ